MTNEELQQHIAHRTAEINVYQVNIDNYRLALTKIADDDEELQPFREQLQNLLSSSLLEQRKSQIIRDVIAEQLADQ